MPGNNSGRTPTRAIAWAAMDSGSGTTGGVVRPFWRTGTLKALESCKGLGSVNFET